ncbi:MAG: DM13 domain-containing protein [Alphaproteobacteria bacterium]
MRRRAFLTATAVFTLLVMLPNSSGADARLLAAGEFRDGDPVHRGSGDLRITQMDGGTRLVEMRNMEIVPGPNLLVDLVAESDPLFPEDVTAKFVSLGKLKSLAGDHDYAIPEDVNLDDWGSVVVWCDTFKTAFTVATIERS